MGRVNALTRISLLSLCASVACASPPPPKSQPSELLDQRPPPFQTQTLSEKPLSSDSFAGHPVVLAFVKTDCPPCERMLEATTAVFHDNERTVAWAIFSPGDNAKVRSFAAKTGLEYPVVVDEQERLKKLFLVSSVPTAVVLDSLGFIRWMSGPEVTASELGQVVEAATKIK